jgi:hypothetical protein
MHRLTILFACLAIFLTLGVGSVAHAMEPIICIDTNAGADIGHVDGDGDQIPADEGKGYPHHHGGCHGHHVATPMAKIDANDGRARKVIVQRSPVVALAATAVDAALRPPQA